MNAIPGGFAADPDAKASGTTPALPAALAEGFNALSTYDRNIIAKRHDALGLHAYIAACMRILRKMEWWTLERVVALAKHFPDGLAGC